MDELLDLLRRNALETAEDLAKMLDCTADEVRTRITAYERQGVIRGYQAVINEDELDTRRVTAVIEVKVTPEREGGFDRIAKRIARFPEVQSVYLMSGAFDLLLFVSGTDLRQVALFVSERLASIEGVTSTATHFQLKTYKSHGVNMEPHDADGRHKVST
ncbi:MAG: Lrp/AsnC family transcriptional regulator [Candidatus Marinimicrobia bacterium]|nr:Lrp/AsnC family transcriptional regulator [Candidatus Neomarinimicrobiota bacterium]